MGFRARLWQEIARAALVALSDARNEMRGQIKYGERENDYAALTRVYADLCRVDADYEQVVTLIDSAERREDDEPEHGDWAMPID